MTSRARAFNDDELLGRYEQTRAYRSAIAHKAARTRQRSRDMRRRSRGGAWP